MFMFLKIDKIKKNLTRAINLQHPTDAKCRLLVMKLEWILIKVPIVKRERQEGAAK